MGNEGPRSIGSLLAGSEALKALREASQDRQRWTRGVQVMLPKELAEHLVAATPEKDTLVLVFDSPVWASRANYMKNELLEALSFQEIRDIKTRVKPAGGSR